MQGRTCSGIIPGTGILEPEIPRAGISGPPELRKNWLRNCWKVVLASTGNCARKFQSTGISESTQKSPPQKRLSQVEKAFCLQPEIVPGNSSLPDFPGAPRRTPKKRLRKEEVSVLAPTGNSGRIFQYSGYSGTPEFPVVTYTGISGWSKQPTARFWGEL